jgi:hypothetical protein
MTHNRPTKTATDNNIKMTTSNNNSAIDDHNKLVTWLKKNSNHPKGIYADPGYTGYYKSFFQMADNSRKFYKSGDIDEELNVGYTEQVFSTSCLPEEDLELEQFIDYVPVSTRYDIELATMGRYSPDEKRDIVKKLRRKCIVILPGTNHSNANFLYKVLNNESQSFKYSVPYVLEDPKKPYYGFHKDAIMQIDKEKFYNFMRDNSKK